MVQGNFVKLLQHSQQVLQIDIRTYKTYSTLHSDAWKTHCVNLQYFEITVNLQSTYPVVLIPLLLRLMLCDNECNMQVSD